MCLLIGLVEITAQRIQCVTQKRPLKLKGETLSPSILGTKIPIFFIIFFKENQKKIKATAHRVQVPQDDMPIVDSAFLPTFLYSIVFMCSF